MNKTKRVAAHKHRAHIRKTKEKRRLAMGPAGMAAEAAKRRTPKKETEAGVPETRRKPVALTEASHADKSAAAKEKPHKEHKPTKKPSESADVKTAPESLEAQSRKTKPAKATVKADKPEAAVEKPSSGENHKAKKPKTDSEA